MTPERRWVYDSAEIGEEDRDRTVDVDVGGVEGKAFSIRIERQEGDAVGVEMGTFRREDDVEPRHIVTMEVEAVDPKAGKTADEGQGLGELTQVTVIDHQWYTIP
jgi:hypothetical protein